VSGCKVSGVEIAAAFYMGCGTNSYGDKNFSYSYDILYFLNRKVNNTHSILFQKCDQNGQILYVDTVLYFFSNGFLWLDLATDKVQRYNRISRPV
jgi:hypothetical protein